MKPVGAGPNFGLGTCETLSQVDNGTWGKWIWHLWVDMGPLGPLGPWDLHFGHDFGPVGPGPKWMVAIGFMYCGWSQVNFRPV
jgi:hypothetical protein